MYSPHCPDSNVRYLSTTYESFEDADLEADVMDVMLSTLREADAAPKMKSMQQPDQDHERVEEGQPSSGHPDYLIRSRIDIRIGSLQFMLRLNLATKK